MTEKHVAGSNDPSWMAAPLRALTTAIVARPGLTVGASLAVTLLALLVTATGLKFKMSRLDLLNPESEYNQRWLSYLKEFGDQDDAVVVVRGQSTDDVLAALDDLSHQLQQPGQPYEAVLSQWDLTPFRAKGLHFVPRQAVRELEQQLASLKPLLSAPQPERDPVAALRRLNDQLEPIDRLPEQHVQFAQQQYGALFQGLAANLPSPALSVRTDRLGELQQLEEGLERFKSHHLLMNDGRMGFVLLRLQQREGETSRGAAAIKQLRETLQATMPRHPQVQMGLTGMPILEFDEMAASADDMARSTWLSFLCVFIFFWASFGSWRHTLFAGATLLIGMAWSFGYLTLLIGHLNILSVAFAAILIGIGIDFSIHYVSHYLNFRSHGVPSGNALIETATAVGPGVVTSAVTTALGFFAATFTEFVGIVELGLIAGGGILLCLVATVVTLPAMIQLVDQHHTHREVVGILRVVDWLAPAKYFPKATMLAALVVTIMIGWGLKDVRYDHNLLNLQPNHLESVEIEREVLAGKDQSFWCALAIADSPAHARDLKARFEQLESVSRVEEVGSLFPSEDPDLRHSIVRLSALLAQLPATAAQLSLPDPQALDAEVTRAQKVLHKCSQGRSSVLPLIAEVHQALQVNLGSVSHTQQQLAAALPMLRSLQTMTDPEPPRLADLPPPIAERYVSDSGKFLVRVYARGHIWDMDALQRFVAEVESVDPRVTGHPVQTFYASRHMQKSYMQSSLYSLLCVVGVLLFDYRSIKHTALALLPLALGVIQMLGIMGLLNIPFNPANMIALPLILGMGVEDGVHLVHEYRRQKGRFQLGNSTAMAVMLTSATTISGFACMIIARHQGLRSLGQILTFGMTTCMVVTLYSLPALLRWMTRHRPELAEDNDDRSPVAEPLAATSPMPWSAPARDTVSGPVIPEYQEAGPAYQAPPRPAIRPRVRPQPAGREALALLSDDRSS
jgi:hopanoid biosynthesis associated RND transporter like protein HpnN